MNVQSECVMHKEVDFGIPVIMKELETEVGRELKEKLQSAKTSKKKSRKESDGNNLEKELRGRMVVEAKHHHNSLREAIRRLKERHELAAARRLVVSLPKPPRRFLDPVHLPCTTAHRPEDDGIQEAKPWRQRQ